MKRFTYLSPCPPAAAVLVLALGLFGCSGTQPATRPMPAEDPSIVARFGDTAFTLDAFETQYARSVGGLDVALKDSLPAYQEFLERYVDFRLKVMAAHDAGYADDERIEEEMDTYRAQLARPYLLEQEVTEPLLRDLYEKQQELIDASHILIRVGPEAPAADSLAAFNKMQALRDSLMQGADFGTLASRHSEDPSAQREGLGGQGRLGYFSGGRMVKAFEDMAYSTPVGEVSPIFRTRFGYHMIKVHDRRDRIDDVKISHIMIRVPSATAADTAAAMAKMDSVLTELAAGKAFADVAKVYSDDQGSKKSGGDLGYIQYDGRLIQPMKDAAFALQKAGDISDVVETQFGFHVIYLADRKPSPTYEESYESLKGNLARLPRSQQAQDDFAKSVLAQNGFSIDSLVINHAVDGIGSDSLTRMIATAKLPAVTDWNQRFAALGDSSYTLNQFAAFILERDGPNNRPTTKSALDMAHEFLLAKAIDYEVAALEERNAAFRATMNEFRDGLLLFKLMEDSVWTAAAVDTVALEAYYSAHAGDYQFPDRTRIVSFTSSNDSLLNNLSDRLKGGFGLSQAVTEMSGRTAEDVRVDTTFIAGPTSSVFDEALALVDGENTRALPYNRGFIVLVRHGMDQARPKTFEEARAEVINDYQQQLEDELLAELRARYAVQTYPERLTAAFADAPNAGHSEMPQANER